MLYRVEILHILLVTLAVASLWLLFAAAFNVQEIIAAVAAGLLAAAAGHTLRVRTGHRQSGFWRWFRYIPSIVLKGLADCWTLTVILCRMLAGRHRRGKFRRISFKYGSDDPDDVGRRILATIGTTLQPNSYVVGFNREKGEVLIHELDPGPEAPIPDEIRRPE